MIPKGRAGPALAWSPRSGTGQGNLGKGQEVYETAGPTSYILCLPSALLIDTSDYFIPVSYSQEKSLI